MSTQNIAVTMNGKVIGEAQVDENGVISAELTDDGAKMVGAGTIDRVSIAEKASLVDTTLADAYLGSITDSREWWQDYRY